MVALAIVGIGVLGFFGAFSFISRSIHISRTRTLATNLAQEKIEILKNLSYYELLVTTSASVDNDFSPSFSYDDSNYPPETISVGGITFTRYTYVGLVQMTNNVISQVPSSDPDTGLKQITETVVWNDGGSWRKWTLTNLLENPNVNPLDSGISGQVQDTLGNPVSGAYVRVDQNTDWSATTDSSGNFSFRVYHGSYTVHASSAGYYDAVSNEIDAEQGGTYPVSPDPLTLQAIASGTVVGNAWLSPDIVISGVAVSSAQANQNGFELQYIELFNPTTATIDIGGSPPALKVNYRTATGCSFYADCSDSSLGIKLTYVSTYVAPGHYYLIANTSTFTLGGLSLTADAVYADDANDYCSIKPNTDRWQLGASPPLKKLIVDGHGGSIWLQRVSGAIVDAVGWNHNSKTPPYYEGTYLTIGDGSGGFPDGEQIVRISSPAANLSASDMNAYGRAYDSGDNAADFVYDPVITSIAFPPSSSAAAAKVSVAGVPAVGAVVAASDPYSGSVTAEAAYISSGSLSLLYAPFSLPAVTTGTWAVVVASGSYFNEYSPVSVAQGQATGIPNSGTTPAWPAPGVYSAMITSGSLSGFVKGTVTDANGNPLGGIEIEALGGIKTTGADGAYFIKTDTGPITVVANPNNLNPSYVESRVNVTLSPGQIEQQNFTLSQGGSAQGYLTSGTTPLPNYVVAATIGGSQYGSGTSDTSGVFTIRNLSTGTYTIQPVLDVGQDSSPSSLTATVSSAGTVWVGTFTVSGAMGTIAGTVSFNSALVTTGALLVASPAALSSTPPAIVASSAPAQTPIYAISSKADGSYSLPVRGNYTYYLSVYVPTLSGASISITTKTYSGISVTPSNTVTKDITVP